MTLKLTGQQRRAALSLRAIRPHCKPGTDVPANPLQGKTWHDTVVRVIQGELIPTALIPAFCEIAGVANADVTQTERVLKSALESAMRNRRHPRPPMGGT